jgi:hypothetical protein
VQLLLRGKTPTRYQLQQRLLKEQPHLRVNTIEFREAFALRTIYVVGPHASIIASFTGYSASFCSTVMNKYSKEAMKAYRAHIQGYDYEPTVAESIKNVGRVIGRAFEKRKLQSAFNKFKQRIMGNKRGLVQG